MERSGPKITFSEGANDGDGYALVVSRGLRDSFLLVFFGAGKNQRGNYGFLGGVNSDGFTLRVCRPEDSKPTGDLLSLRWEDVKEIVYL